VPLQAGLVAGDVLEALPAALAEHSN
jgi:hypothetical protein